MAGDFGIDGVAILRQRDVVDARALQRDAAGNARGLDLDARVAAIAASRLTTGPGRRRRRWPRAWSAGAPGCGAVLPGAVAPGAVCGEGLASSVCAWLSQPLPLHLRHVVEILPGDQHEAGQDDGEDGVAVVGHLFTVSSFGLRRAVLGTVAGRAGRARSEGLPAWPRNRGSARPCGRLAHNHGAVAWI